MLLVDALNFKSLTRSVRFVATAAIDSKIYSKVLFGLGSAFLLASCTEPSQEIITRVDSAPGYTRIDERDPNDPLNASIYELDNGLRVYLTENHEEPRFYAEIAVRAGSKHDPADATGLAHYLEHLLFKGNQHLGTLDYEAEKPHLDRITALYEEHFNTTDEARRAEIYAEINTEAQAAAQFAVPNEIDKLYNAMGGSGLNAHTSNE
jgi:predicted Zn-dependent peptidase